MSLLSQVTVWTLVILLPKLTLPFTFQPSKPDDRDTKDGTPHLPPPPPPPMSGYGPRPLPPMMGMPRFPLRPPMIPPPVSGGQGPRKYILLCVLAISCDVFSPLRRQVTCSSCVPPVNRFVHLAPIIISYVYNRGGERLQLCFPALITNLVFPWGAITASRQWCFPALATRQLCFPVPTANCGFPVLPILPPLVPTMFFRSCLSARGQ